MIYIVSGGALNSTHSLTEVKQQILKQVVRIAPIIVQSTD